MLAVFYRRTRDIGSVAHAAAMIIDKWGILHEAAAVWFHRSSSVVITTNILRVMPN